MFKFPVAKQRKIRKRGGAKCYGDIRLVVSLSREEWKELADIGYVSTAVFSLNKSHILNISYNCVMQVFPPPPALWLSENLVGSRRAFAFLC